MRTDFDLTWRIDSFSDLSNAPEVKFGTVQMNLGSFLSDFLGPIVEKVNAVIEPIKPVLDILTKPLPIISEFGSPINLLQLADFFGYGDYNDFHLRRPGHR